METVFAMEVSSTQGRRWSALIAVALLGLAVAFATTSASGASSGHAVAAKKRCKKGKKSAVAAKKKKCKRKHAATPPTTPTQPTQPSGPVVRADVTWTVTGVLDEADIDVHAFSNGLHTGYNENLSGEENEIPGLTGEPGFESTHERILDTNNPSTVPLTFALCSYYYPDADPAQVNYHFVFANGSAQDGSVSMIPGDIKGIDPKEGGLITLGREKWCPAPPP
jgi:hypothetical protein